MSDIVSPQRVGNLSKANPANKSGELNDFSVCTTWGVTYKGYFLLSVDRRRVNFPDLKAAVKQQRELYRADYILIEDKASGTQLLQDLKAEGIHGLRSYLPPPGADKILRLYAQTSEFESGRVRLPVSAPWVDEYMVDWPRAEFVGNSR
jgi:predicted phage terminase large subunit-like protein